MTKLPANLPENFKIPDGFREIGHDLYGNVVLEQIFADGTIEHIVHPGPWGDTPWFIGIRRGNRIVWYVKDRLKLAA